jgi:hypothetical protein
MKTTFVFPPSFLSRFDDEFELIIRKKDSVNITISHRSWRYKPTFQAKISEKADRIELDGEIIHTQLFIGRSCLYIIFSLFAFSLNAITLFIFIFLIFLISLWPIYLGQKRKLYESLEKYASA